LWRLLQYRNKAAGKEVRLEQARALRELTHEFDVPLIINDDVMLAHGIDAEGVHLGGADDSLTGAREVLGSGKLIGMSCYNRLALAHEAVRRGADYVAFGSFFVSTVKPDAVAATPDLLLQAHREFSVPLVAIGGITMRNGPQLLEAGANALAVISALFGAKDIQGTARQFANLNFS
jgi:thiamine-phosphate pyrophosphorylase